MTDSVLLLSGDPRRRGLLTHELHDLGFTVEPSRWLSEAHRRAGRRNVDAVIVDADLLDISSTVGELVSHDLPVVVVSAQGYRGAVAALEAGAADHIPDTAHPEELAARVRGAIRRRGHPTDIRLETDDFVLMFAERRAVRGDTEVHLTPTEWAIVGLMARNPGQVITQDRLLAEVWGIDGRVRSGYVRVFMNTIRRKLEPNPAQPRYFRTVHGVGVRLEVAGAGEARRSLEQSSATRR